MAKIINFGGDNRLNTPLGGNIARSRLVEQLLRGRSTPNVSTPAALGLHLGAEGINTLVAALLAKKDRERADTALQKEKGEAQGAVNSAFPLSLEAAPGPLQPAGPQPVKQPKSQLPGMSGEEVGFGNSPGGFGLPLNEIISAQNDISRVLPIPNISEQNVTADGSVIPQQRQRQAPQSVAAQGSSLAERLKGHPNVAVDDPAARNANAGNLAQALQQRSFLSNRAQSDNPANRQFANDKANELLFPGQLTPAQQQQVQQFQQGQDFKQDQLNQQGQQFEQNLAQKKSQFEQTQNTGETTAKILKQHRIAERGSREKIANQNLLARLEEGKLNRALNPKEEAQLEKLNKARQDSIDKVRTSYTGFLKKNTNLTKTIDDAIKLVETNPSTAGLFGQATQFFAGSNSRKLEAMLNTIRANLGFGELAEMRQNSPTGGAVGQLSEKELVLLSAVEASLDQFQGNEQLIKHLNRIKTLAIETRKERVTEFTTSFGDQPVGNRRKTDIPPPPPGFEVQ